jgi:hypothetical protein
VPGWNQRTELGGFCVTNPLLTLNAPPGKSAANFFVCGESSSISRRYSQLNRSTKTCFLDHVIPGSIGRQLFGQGVDFLAYCLTGFDHEIPPYAEEIRPGGFVILLKFSGHPD